MDVGNNTVALEDRDDEFAPPANNNNNDTAPDNVLHAEDGGMNIQQVIATKGNMLHDVLHAKDGGMNMQQVVATKGNMLRGNMLRDDDTKDSSSTGVLSEGVDSNSAGVRDIADDDSDNGNGNGNGNRNDVARRTTRSGYVSKPYDYVNKFPILYGNTNHVAGTSDTLCLRPHYYNDRLSLRLGAGIGYGSSFFTNNVKTTNLNITEYSGIILGLDIEEYQLCT